MDKRVSSRAIIIEDNKLLAMFRRKVKDGKTKEYYVIPGGGRENNETLEENVIRELKEEFEIDIKILGYLGVEEHENTIEHYFHCKRVSGTPKISGEELERMTQSNYYEPRYIDLTNLDNIDINAKDKVRQALQKNYRLMK
ncbi:MAG: NUDIX domain-containing protein [Clostridium sp.]|nr:NUDIX domain-containing protein [Clostridium sp.]